MKKKFYLLSLAILTALPGILSAQVKLQVNTKAGETKTFVLDDIRKLGFSGNQFTVVTSSSSPFDIDAVLSIKFSGLTSGIDTAPTADTSGKLSITRSGQSLTVNGWQGGQATARIYSAGGQMLSANRNWSGQPISIAMLPKGVYILKINNQTIKFTR